MTMPSKIYAVDARKRPDDSPSGVWSERNFTTRDAYIRAEIAEDLARALAGIKVPGYGLHPVVQAALTRYRNALDTRASSV